MSGRHSGGTGSGLRISALPQTLKMIFRLAPRQLNDEIALAKVEIKRKGTQLGIAGAFFAVGAFFASGVTSSTDHGRWASRCSAWLRSSCSRSW